MLLCYLWKKKIRKKNFLEIISIVIYFFIKILYLFLVVSIFYIMYMVFLFFDIWNMNEIYECVEVIRKEVFILCCL